MIDEGAGLWRWGWAHPSGRWVAGLEEGRQAKLRGWGDGRRGRKAEVLGPHLLMGILGPQYPCQASSNKPLWACRERRSLAI